MTNRDPYQVLGVPRSASEAEIKKAYRTLAKNNHPDRHADNPAALERFKNATAAYDLLSDKEKRARFDRGEIDADGNPTNPFAGGFSGGGFRAGADPFSRGSASGRAAGFEFGGVDDLFSELFGGLGGAMGGRGGATSGSGGFRQPRGPDVQYRLTIPFEDAARLTPQRITLRDGKLTEVRLPAGFRPGVQLRLGGKGEPGPGGPGDALVTLEVAPHRHFRRDGDDIRLDLPVTLAEAVKGAKVRAPTVDGPVQLTIPPGTSSGKVFRLKGRGFTRADGQRADQLITIQIDVPADDPALARFIEGWADPRPLRAGLGV